MVVTSVPPDGGGHIHEGGGNHVQEGGGGANKGMSYSERLKTNVRFDQRLKRNVLEITLEKTDREADFDVDGEDVARVAKTLGIDIISQTQGYQLQYRGKFSVISIWMVPGIDLDRFCKDVNIRVTDNVMTGVIRPSGKKDVTVSIVGLDFNTPDPFVFEYLNKFGVVVNQSVIYTKIESGAWKGKYSGERKYQVDFTKATHSMGNYHMIDGSKVRVYFRGNKKTCGRCHKNAGDCPGKAIAKDCGDNGGERIMLSEHMKTLWSKVGFVPTSFELNSGDEKIEDDGRENQLIRDTNFPPNINRPEPTVRDIKLYDGIIVKNIPKTIETKDIMAFLFNYGVPHDHPSEKIRINKRFKNTSVVIDGISPDQVQIIFKSIHYPDTNQKFFDTPIYCTPIRNMTPEKPTNHSHVEVEKAVEETNDGANKQVDESTWIPGLTKSQQKKAMKEAKEKKVKEDKKKMEETKDASKSGSKAKKDDKNTKEPKRKFDFLKKDLVKCRLIDDDIEDQFSFGENSDDDDQSFKPGLNSKFFKNTPSNKDELEKLLSPCTFGSILAQRIQKELEWQNSVDESQNLKKRLLSPEDIEKLRKTRKKH